MASMEGIKASIVLTQASSNIFDSCNSLLTKEFEPQKGYYERL